MLMSWVMIVAFVASVAVPVLGVIALVTFLRRGRHLPGDVSQHDAVLDSLDQVHVRLDALGERLARVERALDPGRHEALGRPPEDADGPRSGDTKP